MRRVELPGFLGEALKALFPTLAWERVVFILGIPWPFSAGSEDGITLPAGHARIRVCLRPEVYDPASPRFLLLCAHELVHALQVQQSPCHGRGIGLLGAFTWQYLTCFLRAWSAAPGRGNRYEDEAYAYEDLLARALAATGPEAGLSPAALARVEPGVIKVKADARGACAARVFAFAAAGAAGARRNAAVWAVLGAAIGALAGGPVPGGAAVGAAAGAAAGALAGLFDAATGIPSGVAAAGLIVIGAIVDAIVALAGRAARHRRGRHDEAS